MAVRQILTTLGGLAALAAAIGPAAAAPEGGFRRFPEPIQGYFLRHSQIDEPQYAAVRDEAGWRRLWSRITARSSSAGSPPPQVDFGREMLLVAAAGVRPTGGYAMRIAEVRETRNAIVVQVVRTSRGPRCGATAALTQPADIVLVRASAKPIAWRFRDIASRC